MTRPAHHYVVLKAFGDLTIAAGALMRHAGGAHAPALLIGSHLVDLFDALGRPVDHEVVETGEAGVPACFDARRAGPTQAVASLLRLRSNVGSTSAALHSTLVFDRLGLRERLMTLRHNAAALPPQANIYAAYDASLAQYGYRPLAGTPPLATTGDVIGVFPGSRIAVKNFSPMVVDALLARIAQQGCSAQLVLLAGERPDLESRFSDAIIVPRSFTAMVDAVRHCGRLIAADSMPAHIAEFFNIPVFVLSPIDNSYWLPASCFALRLWSTFDGAQTSAALRAFIEGDRVALARLRA